MKSIAHKGIITSIRSKKDRSISYSVDSPELSPQEKALFFELQNLNVNLVITPLEEQAETYTVDKDLEQKSPSKRLQAVLFVLWKQEQPTDEFDTFYKLQMEKIIDHFKNKLV